MSHLLTIEAAARTEIGGRRTVNQDAIALRDDLNLYILADGMGGHAAGEVASAIAVEVMQQFFLNAGATWPPTTKGPASDPCAFLVAAVQHASTRIRQLAALHAEYRGMGAAIAVVHTSGAGFCVAHVGHVRVYRFRNGGLELLTEDHTRLNRYRGQGATYDHAKAMSDASILIRALGLRAITDVTVRLEDARPGDVVMLVSNGLYNAVSAAQMAQLLAAPNSLSATTDALIEVAQAHEAPDDMSCVLLRWSAEEAPNVAA